MVSGLLIRRLTDRRPSGVLSALLVAVCVGSSCLGCSSGSKDAPTVAPVVGKVTRKGTPLPGARVTFTPIELAEGTPAIPSFATTDESGNYTLLFNRDLKGAIIAKHRVQIVKDAAFDDDDRPIKGGIVIPAQYSSQTTLEAIVPEAGLQGGPADFDLDF